MQKKTGAQIHSPEAETSFLQRAGTLARADIEAVLIRARMQSALEGDAAADLDDLISPVGRQSVSNRWTLPPGHRLEDAASFSYRPPCPAPDGGRAVAACGRSRNLDDPK